MSILGSTKRTLFVAYPWEIYIKGMYDEILTTLSKSWDIRHGSDITKEDVSSAEVEMFRNRNKQLYDIFVSGIEKSEVFIADVTNTSANVMLELGIAIQLNKNVLIVTSEDPKDLPFDIKGFKVNRYKSKQELIGIINQQLELFLKIKNQDFNSYFKESYLKVEKGELKHAVAHVIPLREKIKNLKLRLEYKFVNVSSDDDWLGVHLRAQTPSITSSELVYVRKNEKLEVVTYPGRRTPVIGVKKQATTIPLSDGYNKLEIILEENKLEAFTSEYQLQDPSIQIETFGDIILHAWAHDLGKISDLQVEYRNVEIISLDTISPVS